MSQFSDIINQLNQLTGYQLPTASNYIISQSQTPLGSGSVNNIIDKLNTLTGFDIPYTNIQFVSGANVAGPVIIYTPSTAGGTISTDGILPGSVIRADHVLRIINALNGVNEDIIIISGSLLTSGSNIFNGSLSLPFIPEGKYLYTSGGYIVGVDTSVESASYAFYSTTASYAENAGKFDTGSLLTTASFYIFTASYTTASFTGSFSGDGSGLTNIPGTSTGLASSLTANQSVGGIDPGTTFAQGDSLENVLRAMLVGYIPPTLGGLSLKNDTTIVLNANTIAEVSSSYIFNTASFTATADSPNGRYPYSSSFTASGATIDGFSYYFGDNVLGSNNNLELGSEREIQSATNGTVTFTINAKNPETNATITQARVLSYVYPFFWGMSATDYSTTGNVPGAAGITKSVSGKGTKLVSLEGTNKYIYFAYPTIHGNLSTITDGNGFNVTTAFNKFTRIQTGSAATPWSVSYNIYIATWDGSAINPTTISPAQTFTFTF